MTCPISLHMLITLEQPFGLFVNFTGFLYKGTAITIGGVGILSTLIMSLESDLLFDFDFLKYLNSSSSFSSTLNSTFSLTVLSCCINFSNSLISSSFSSIMSICIFSIFISSSSALTSSSFTSTIISSSSFGFFVNKFLDL
jgi:hypothetical protein